jgi:hypothetical protein
LNPYEISPAMTMKFATIAIQDFASITLIGRGEHGAGCEALDSGQ